MSWRLVALLAVISLSASPTAAFADNGGAGRLGAINHIVVIYEENHSFDNLYGGWEGVNGLANPPAAHTTQIGQGGAPYSRRLQEDVNLPSPPLAGDCTDTSTGTSFVGHFPNRPFSIETFIP